eukprot:CCRYP_013639-RD/>CCRYP_013639-RD protein AED:0.31 eAED:0.49 QI:0/0/0.33/1/0/0/3/697/101
MRGQYIVMVGRPTPWGISTVTADSDKRGEAGQSIESIMAWDRVIEICGCVSAEVYATICPRSHFATNGYKPRSFMLNQKRNLKYVSSSRALLHLWQHDCFD